MILAIDFDGVIHDFKNPVKGRRMGPPIAGAPEALQKFARKGHRVIIFCVWAHGSGLKVISDWCDYYKVSRHDITNIKPQADYYIDDKAIRFTTWQEVIPLLK